MANPRRRTRALRYFGAGVWPVGLLETIFRSVILALGGWPDGLPRATQSGGILEAAVAYAIRGPKPMSQHGRPRLSRARTKPVAAMAVLSPRSGRMARSLDSGCGLPISYCPVQAVYQRPGQAIFRKSWRSECSLYQTSQPQWPLYQGQGPGQWPQWPFYQLGAATSLD